ncbi:MAG TPA: hypothetical protein VFF59_10200 [Anaerolineae bacterium]|nr:hypothetical protein [Anaerolineae bacterium]
MTYSEPEKITIIEGPPPEFMLAQDVWSMSMWEGTQPRSVGVCQMRTFNAGTLMERCQRAWGEGRPVQLDFPQMDGLRQKVEILAAKPGRAEEGDLLYLWVAVPSGVIKQHEAFDDASLDDSESGEADETDDDDLSAFA